MSLRVHDDRLTARVGALVLGVVAVAAVFVVAILPRLDRGGGLYVRIYFSQITAISEGAPVSMAGHTIGTLSAISLVRAQDTLPGHPLHGSGGIAAVARIDEDWAARIPINAEFFVTARGVFAPRYIEIGPPPGRALPGRPLTNGDEVRGVDPPSLDRLLQRTWDNLTETKVFMDALRPQTAALKASIARLSLTLGGLEDSPGQFDALDAALAGAIAETVAMIDGLRAGNVDLSAVPRLAARAKALMARVEETVAAMRARVTLLQIALRRVQGAVPPELSGKLDAALADAQVAFARVEHITATVQAIVADVAAGKGSIGGFMTDLEMFDDVKEMTREMKTQPWRVVGHPADHADQ